MSAKGFFRWSVVVFSLFLSACGGGGGGTENQPGSIVLSGVVEDGPIEGARVFLRNPQGETLRICGASGIGRCETVTDSKGSFYLRVRSEALSDPLELTTYGGMDTQTGVSFTGMPLRVPLKLFQGAEDRIVVTPLTSLLASRMRNEPNPSIARGELALELGLAEGDLLARPSSHPEILHRALLLTLIAMELAEAGKEDPFALMGEKSLGPPAMMQFGPILLNRQLNPARLHGWFENGIEDDVENEIIGRLQEIERDLHAGTAPLAARFRKAALVQAFKKNLTQMQDTPVDIVAPLASHLGELADKILEACGSTIIPLRGMVTQRIARYVLFQYRLVTVNSDGSISLAPLISPSLPSGVDALSADPRIAELAALKALHSVSVPLLKSEMPGDDNLKRLHYFYNSDISPFYHAEKLAAEVADDRVGDLMMLEVAKGKALAGLLKEARLIVDTQIFQAQQKALAYREVAQTAISLGENKEALETLQLAEFFMRQHYALKPPGSLVNADYTFIQRVASLYRKAGNNLKAKEIVDYLKTFIPSNPAATLYGSIIVESWKLVDEHIADNEFGSARLLVEFMEDLSMSTPSATISGRPSFKAKVYYLIETAKRYTALGQYSDASRIYDVVRSIRAGDPVTLEDTWVYMPDFVEMLYQWGRRQEALELADSIPAPHNAVARKFVATYEAVWTGVDSAISFIESQFPAPADRIDVLTYSQANPGRAFVAQELIERGRIAEARKAIDMAAVLLPALSYASDTDRYTFIIQRGYVKIADLYRQIGEQGTALRLLGEAEAITASLTGLQNQISGLLDIRRVYLQLGHGQKADELFLIAFRSVEERKGILTGTERATQLERLAKASWTMPNREYLAHLLLPLAEATREMVPPSLSGTPRETALGNQVDQYLRTVKHALLLDDPMANAFLGKPGREFAYDLLERAVLSAGSMSVAASRVAKFNSTTADSILGVYATAGYVDRALELMPVYLTTPNARNVGFQSIARIYVLRDDFPGFDSASIDIDRDLRPDFFHPLRPVDPGLELDRDSDGDGIPDVEDRRPFFYDFNSRAWA